MSQGESRPPRCDCGADCDCATDGDGPCWGEVCARDMLEWDDGEGGMDWMWIHACEGHRDRYFGGDYIPQPAEEVKR